MAYCKTVWLIDDEEISLQLTAHILQINNFCTEVRTFDSGPKALVELEKLIKVGEFPDFIFLDLNMPVINGWDFLHAYREVPQQVKEKCTLYILSSTVDEEDINRCKLYEDVRDFLMKPFNKMDIGTIKFQAEKISHRLK